MCFSYYWNWLSQNASNVIALCALGATFWQAWFSRKHNKLSVTPYLTIDTNTSNVNNTFIIEIVNKGAGPAIVKELKCYFDQLEKDLDSIKLTLDTTFPEQMFECSFGQVEKGYVMSVNDRCLIMKIKFLEPVLPEKIKIDELLNRVKVVIKYESIYKEKYIEPA